MKILMCKPEYYGIFYEINKWMDINRQVHQTLAKNQWQALYETLLNIDVTVELVPPVAGLPDLIFTANAGLINQQKVLISTFKTKERQPESRYFAKWFLENGFEIVNESDDYTAGPAFEGAGDALYFNDYLVAAFGFRSEISVYKKTFFKQFNLLLCELVDPYFYHLDTCFCPINKSIAIWYPKAFSLESQSKMREMGQLIEVSEREAKNFACNAVVVGKNVILPTDCPEISSQLEELGFIVHSCAMSEFIKAGGACKCLTLMLI